MLYLFDTSALLVPPMNTAELIYQNVKTLPEPEAREVLDFVEFIQLKRSREREVLREEALATLDKHQGLYDGSPFNRDELHERP